MANAAGDPWTEESLWIAAQYRGTKAASTAPMARSIVNGWMSGDPTPRPDPAYYQKLADRFPTGALAPYARWSVAECLRRGNLVASSEDQKTPMGELLAQFEKVKAAPSTRAWAWAQLRMGWIRYLEGQHAQARQNYLAVANSMGPGPEQSMALIDAAYCYDAQNQYAESERLLRLLLEQPDVVWVRAGEWWAWSPNCGSAINSGPGERPP